VRAEQSPINMYLRQNSHDSSIEDHVYLDIQPGLSPLHEGTRPRDLLPANFNAPKIHSI
jgi:hypothetical protein